MGGLGAGCIAIKETRSLESQKGRTDTHTTSGQHANACCITPRQMRNTSLAAHNAATTKFVAHDKQKPRSHACKPTCMQAHSRCTQMSAHHRRTHFHVHACQPACMQAHARCSHMQPATATTKTPACGDDHPGNKAEGAPKGRASRRTFLMLIRAWLRAPLQPLKQRQSMTVQAVQWPRALHCQPGS